MFFEICTFLHIFGPIKIDYIKCSTTIYNPLTNLIEDRNVKTNQMNNKKSIFKHMNNTKFLPLFNYD